MRVRKTRDGGNAMPGLRGLNAIAGLRGLNAIAGLRGLNAMPGLRGLNAMMALLLVLAACSSDDPLKQIQGEGDPPALPHLSVQQADVSDQYTVTLLPSGTDAQGVPTLDICAATYPSEQLRVARRQVGVVDGQQRLVLSTEAVAYQDPKDTVQAFAELRKVRAECPAEFQRNGSGDLVLSTFGPDPDTSWPAPPPGIERLAYDVFMVYEGGAVTRTVAVYLRRGRVLLGLYFFVHPDAPIPSVQGRTTVSGIVDVFATRMTELAASVVTP